MDKHDCLKVKEITNLKADVDNLKEKVINIEESQKVLHEMNTNIKIMVEQNTYRDKEIQNVQTSIVNVQSDIKEIKEKPQKDYDRIKWTIITILITGSTTAVLTNLGNIIRVLGQ